MPDRQQRPQELTAATFVEAVGGVRGLVESALPATVFVLVKLFTDGLWPASVAAVVVGLVLAADRVRRGESLQQVGSGFFGLLVAVVVARTTGSGEGFFLPGILFTGLLGVVFLVSVLVGRPAIGVALAGLDPKWAGWREHPPLRRAVQVATLFWALTFFVRAAIAGYVYSLDGDNDGALLVTVNVVKWPLIVAAAVLTVWLVKRAGIPEDEPAER